MFRGGLLPSPAMPREQWRSSFTGPCRAVRTVGGLAGAFNRVPPAAYMYMQAGQWNQIVRRQQGPLIYHENVSIRAVTLSSGACCTRHTRFSAQL